MRILFNIIFSAILAIGLVGFWTLFLNLWKPKKKWPAWVGYIIIIGAWFAAIRYYILNQVDLYGTIEQQKNTQIPPDLTNHVLGIT